MTAKTRQKIVIIGCGNLAWHLAKKLSSIKKFDLEVYNHKANPSLLNFKNELKCSIHQNLNKINDKAQYYFICVNDKNIKAVSKKIRVSDKNAIVIHTSGNSDIKKLNNKIGIKGVIYPLQTFSKTGEVNWNEIPLFIESTNKQDISKVKSLAQLFSKRIVELNSKDRAKLHLSAVLVNNFTNSLYVVASEYIQSELKAVNFKLLLPLIDQTVSKIKKMTPLEAQTGPAKRGDKKVIMEHLKLLKKHKEIKSLYKIFTKLIQKQN